MRFNRTHVMLHMDDTRECNLMINYLANQIVFKSRMLTTRSSNGNGMFYVKRQIRSFDIDDAINCFNNGVHKNRVRWGIILETVKQDLHDFPEGVPDTSDEWELKDIAIQSERVKRFHNDKRRIKTSHAKKLRNRRRADFISRFNEQFGKDKPKGN